MIFAQLFMAENQLCKVFRVGETEVEVQIIILKEVSTPCVFFLGICFGSA